MPAYFVSLAFSNIDFNDDELIETLADQAPWIQWLEVDGEVRALITRDAKSPVELAVQSVVAIKAVAPNAAVARVVEDFVTIPDIARRVGVHRETVRTWVKGTRGPGDFPTPRDTVGDSIHVWDWASVNFWIRTNYELGDVQRLLTPSEIADVSRALEQVTRTSKPWCMDVVYVDWQRAHGRKEPSSVRVLKDVTSHPVSKTAAH